MTKFTAAFASTAAALLLAGPVFAQMPAAGQSPLFENEVRFNAPAKTELKTEVQTEAARQPVSIKDVAVGTGNSQPQPAASGHSPTRAEVRQQARDVSAYGSGPFAGEPG